MVTKGRPERVLKSLEGFSRQSYPNKEIIILSQGCGDANWEIYKISTHFDNVQFFEAPKHLSLGAMRNASIELTTGDIICQWDDDDLYDSKRLITQYKAMLSEDAQVSLYTQFLKFFEHTREMYWVDWSQEHNFSHRFLCGTIMFYKRLHHEYRNMLYPEHGLQSDVEEDLHVLEKFLAKGKIAGVSAGHQYIYVYHGENTYDLAHHELGIDTSWKKTLKTKDELLAQKSLLENTFKQVGITGSVNMMSQDESVFTSSVD
jgi:glycosyltransferase involved in cell wall biosynthesis